MRKKQKIDRHTRHIYLFITESQYGQDIYPYGTYQRATKALRNRMEELFRKNNMTKEEEKPHRKRYRLRDSYELPIEGDETEYGHIETLKVL